MMTDELKKLISGNKQFRKKYFSEHKELFNELVQFGQKPKTLIVACSDSRVDPAMIFNCKPGELFVIRNVANLVPPCETDNNTSHGTSAALEFGTKFLGVQNIIILGHTQCGGIQALMENGDNLWQKNRDSFIAQWMQTAWPAYDRVIRQSNNASSSEKLLALERDALINSMNNLNSFPWIADRVKSGALALHAWHFDLVTGIVDAYDQLAENWQPLAL